MTRVTAAPVIAVHPRARNASNGKGVTGVTGAPGRWSTINILVPWVALDGYSLACARCGAQGRAPVLRDLPTYNGAVERLLAEHRGCHEEGCP